MDREELSLSRVPKMISAHCFLFPVDTRSDKMTRNENQSSDKCIYFQTPLSVPSLKLLLERL